MVQDLSSLKSLSNCHNLTTVYLNGNAISSISNYRHQLLKIIPQLEKIDDECVNSPDFDKKCDCLNGLSYSQNKTFDNMMKKIDIGFRISIESGEEAILKQLTLQCEVWKELHNESFNQLHAHKNLNNHQNHLLSMEKCLSADEGSDLAAVANSEEENNHAKLLEDKEGGARKGDVLGEEDFSASLHTYTAIQITSSIKIQSMYRGFRVRKIYRNINYVKTKQPDCDGDSDDSDYAYEEINLNQFDFNDKMIDWKAPATPQLSSRSPLPDIHSSQQ